MCRKLYVTNKLSLGNRDLGWEAFSLPKGEVVELTSKQLKDIIKDGGTDQVYGLKINEEPCRETATLLAARFIAKLPELRRILATDVEAAYYGDPAATCFGEIFVLHTHDNYLQTIGRYHASSKLVGVVLYFNYFTILVLFFIRGEWIEI